MRSNGVLFRLTLAGRQRCGVHFARPGLVNTLEQGKEGRRGNWTAKLRVLVKGKPWPSASNDLVDSPSALPAYCAQWCRVGQAGVWRAAARRRAD
eukprot:6197233-Pleurochrysis_carterae.AAC.1